MKKFNISLISCILFFVFGNIALVAHPGHGATNGHAIVHYLSEPIHTVTFAAVLLMIAGSATWLILRKKKAAGHA